MIKKVRRLHNKHGFPTGETDELSENTELQDFRIKFLTEEIDELKEALDTGDRVGVFDALLDLVYVAQGTALMAGITPEKWAKGMKAVHKANMKKKKVKNADESKRGHHFDCVKPKNWVGPETTLAEILKEE